MAQISWSDSTRVACGATFSIISIKQSKGFVCWISNFAVFKTYLIIQCIHTLSNYRLVGTSSAHWHLRLNTIGHYFPLTAESVVAILDKHAQLNQETIDQQCDRMVQKEYDARSKRRDWNNYPVDDQILDQVLEEPSNSKHRICSICRTTLRRMTRKHHCRQCRRLVCHKSTCVQKMKLHGSRGFKSKVYVCTNCASEMTTTKQKQAKWCSDWRQSVLSAAKAAMLSRGVGEWGCRGFGQYVRVLTSESLLEVSALVGNMFVRQAARDLTRSNVRICNKKFLVSSNASTSLGDMLHKIWSELEGLAGQLPVNLATMEYLRVVVLLLGQGALSFLLVLVTQLYKQHNDYMFKNGSDLPPAFVPHSYVGSTISVDVLRRHNKMPTLTVSHVRPFDVRQWLPDMDEPVRCGVLLLRVMIMYQAHPKAVGLGRHSLQVLIKEDIVESWLPDYHMREKYMWMWNKNYSIYCVCFAISLCLCTFESIHQYYK